LLENIGKTICFNDFLIFWFSHFQAPKQLPWCLEPSVASDLRLVALDVLHVKNPTKGYVNVLSLSQCMMFFIGCFYHDPKLLMCFRSVAQPPTRKSLEGSRRLARCKAAGSFLIFHVLIFMEKKDRCI
jgi:hypothetical protein